MNIKSNYVSININNLRGLKNSESQSGFFWFFFYFFFQLSRSKYALGKFILNVLIVRKKVSFDLWCWQIFVRFM